MNKENNFGVARETSVFGESTNPNARRTPEEQVALDNEILSELPDLVRNMVASDAEISSALKKHGWDVSFDTSTVPELDRNGDQEKIENVKRRQALIGVNANEAEIAKAVIISNTNARTSFTKEQIIENILRTRGFQIINNNKNSYVPIVNLKFTRGTLDAYHGKFSDYLDGVDIFDKFLAGYTLPKEVRSEKLTVTFNPTKDDFYQAYRMFDKTEPANHIRERIYGVTNAGFSLIDGSLRTRSINLNVEAMPKTADSGFSTDKAMTTHTIVHELAHSMEHYFVPDKKHSKGSSMYRNLYRDTAQETSPYSRQNPAEHFAEAMTKYILTGEATPEFISYLKYLGYIKN